MFINVKMKTFVGILTLISMMKITYETLKAKKFFFQNFSFLSAVKISCSVELSLKKVYSQLSLPQNEMIVTLERTLRTAPQKNHPTHIHQTQWEQQQTTNKLVWNWQPHDPKPNTLPLSHCAFHLRQIMLNLGFSSSSQANGLKFTSFLTQAKNNVVLIPLACEEGVSYGLKWIRYVSKGENAVTI